MKAIAIWRLIHAQEDSQKYIHVQREIVEREKEKDEEGRETESEREVERMGKRKSQQTGLERDTKQSENNILRQRETDKQVRETYAKTKREQDNNRKNAKNEMQTTQQHQKKWRKKKALLHNRARTLNVGESASAGTGMTICTLLAVERRLKWLLALIMYSTRLCECRSITLSIQISGLTFWRAGCVGLGLGEV